MIGTRTLWWMSLRLKVDQRIDIYWTSICMATSSGTRNHNQCQYCLWHSFLYTYERVKIFPYALISNMSFYTFTVLGLLNRFKIKMHFVIDFKRTFAINKFKGNKTFRSFPVCHIGYISHLLIQLNYLHYGMTDCNLT